MVCHACRGAVVFDKEDYIKIVLQSGARVWYHGECFWHFLREELKQPEINIVATLTD